MPIKNPANYCIGSVCVSESVREHTYELLQDYRINMGGWSKRVRICQRYHEGFSLITRSVITAGSHLLTTKPVPNRAMLRGM